MGLQKVCAWCETILDTPADGVVEDVSHGICEACRENFFGDNEGERSLEEFLDRLDAPVLVVDGEVTVLTANRAARDLLGKDLGDLRGYSGGAVMECAYARLPDGCGRTVHCDGCAIRQTVLATRADGVSRRGVEAFQELAGQRSRILITTEKAGDLVLLRIDSNQPEAWAGTG